MLAKKRFDGSNFGKVTQWCRRAVGIDVVDLFGHNTSHCYGSSHGIYCAESFRVWSCQVIGIGGCANSNNFTVNFCSASLCRLKRFKNQRSPTFAHHKAVTIAVVRA